MASGRGARVSDARLVSGVMTRDACIDERQLEESGRFVFADFSGDSTWFAGESIVVHRSAFRSGETFADFV